jgi:hypothetical protein
MVLILSLEVLLSGDSVNLHREREAFIFTQPLCARVLLLESHSHGLVASLRRNQIHRKIEDVVYNFFIQGFQSCHYGLWSKVNFPMPLDVV